MNTTIKPCGVPCPKCGGTDIYRKFHARRSYIDESDWSFRRRYGDWEKQYKGLVKRNRFRGFEVTTDFIAHHCRVCGFDWATPPLEQL